MKKVVHTMKLFMILLHVYACLSMPTLEESVEVGDFFEGDMILTPEQMEQVEKSTHHIYGAGIKNRLWITNGKAETIKYFIDPELAQKTKAVHGIDMAIKDYHNFTCIRFQRVNEKPTGPHIYFVQGKGCSSFVGKLKHQNRINLGRGCWGKGTVSHEIGHSLGFFHEQSRPDRDQYVKILFENIKDGRQGNFKKYGYNRIDTRGLEYDLDSMMHYGGKFFSKDGKHGLLTIQTLDPKNQHRIGQRKGMSVGDIAVLNKMYFC